MTVEPDDILVVWTCLGGTLKREVMDAQPATIAAHLMLII